MGAAGRATETEPSVRTRSELRELARARVGSRLLVSVSNREPFEHVRLPDGSLAARPAVGGLTLALGSVMQAVGGVWVAHGSGSADREASDERGRVAVPPGRPAYHLQRVWLDAGEVEGYYNGFANQALWPLCHSAFAKPLFREAHWQAYRAVNARFAEAVARVAGDREVVVFVQDYHFALLPAMLRRRCPRATCLHFWHIPWPLPDILEICPWSAELLAGALGSDVLGFHTPQYARRFADAACALPGWRRDGDGAVAGDDGRRMRVGAFPISIDFDGIAARASSAECDAAVARLRERHGLAGKFVAVGVDRLDYTKGLVERLQAIDCLLERHPEMRGRFAYLHAGAPSRTDIPAYLDLQRDLDRAVARVNRRFGGDGYSPVVALRERLSESDVLALYRLADVCVVSSLEDGMNLVAKEFLAARNDERGRLLLSRFAGAAWELPGAECFNPFAIDEFAGRLRDMARPDPAGEVERMRRLRRHVRQHNIFGWIGSILETVPGPGSGG